MEGGSIIRNNEQRCDMMHRQTNTVIQMNIKRPGGRIIVAVYSGHVVITMMEMELSWYYRRNQK